MSKSGSGKNASTTATSSSDPEEVDNVSKSPSQQSNQESNEDSKPLTSAERIAQFLEDAKKRQRANIWDHFERMQLAPKHVVDHFKKIEKVMNRHPVDFDDHFHSMWPNNPGSHLGPNCLNIPDGFIRILKAGEDGAPLFLSETLYWPLQWGFLRLTKGWPLGSPSKSVGPKTQTPSPVASSTGSPYTKCKKNWHDWYKALKPKLSGFWDKIGISHTLELCAIGSFPCDHALIQAGLCFWSTSTNCMRLRFGMMTPTLLDLAAMLGLRPHGVHCSAASLPDPTLDLSYDKNIKAYNGWVNFYYDLGSPVLPTNEVSRVEHVAFLQLWLCKYFFCPLSCSVTKDVQPLAEVLADGQCVALGPLILGHLYRTLATIAHPTPMFANVSGPLWIFQLWLQLYFPELGPPTPNFTNNKLLGYTLLSLPLPDHNVEECFKFLYNCEAREDHHFSICLDRRHPNYLALSLDALPADNVADEHKQIWASILVARDIPFGLLASSSNNYECGCELYYPTAVGRQFGFAQAIPSPIMESENFFSSWRVSFKKVEEVKNFDDFQAIQLAAFYIESRQPDFGCLREFCDFWIKMSATWFNESYEVHAARIFQGCPTLPKRLNLKPTTPKSKAASKVASSPIRYPPTNCGKKREFSSVRGAARGNSVRNDDIQPVKSSKRLKSTRNVFKYVNALASATRTNSASSTIDSQEVVLSTTIPKAIESVGGQAKGVRVGRVKRILQPTNSVAEPRPTPAQPSTPTLHVSFSRLELLVASDDDSLPPATTLTDVLERDPTAEATIRAFLDRDLISITSQADCIQFKTAIENLVGSNFFTNPSMATTVKFFMTELERLIPSYLDSSSQLEMSKTLESEIASIKTSLRNTIDFSRQSDHELTSINERRQQLQSEMLELDARKQVILKEKSDRYYAIQPIETRLIQRKAEVKEINSKKMALLDTKARGDDHWTTFKMMLRPYFLDH